MSFETTYQTVLLNNGARGNYKFYQAAIIRDPSTFGHNHHVLFNWGAGDGSSDMSSGQVQYEGPFNSESAALTAVNKKTAAKMKDGYWHDRFVVQLHEAPLATNYYMASFIPAASPHTSNLVAPRPATTAAQRTQDALNRADTKLASVTTTTAILLGRTLDSETAMLIVEERESLTEQRRKLVTEIDQIDIQIQALNAKLVS